MTSRGWLGRPHGPRLGALLAVCAASLAVSGCSLGISVRRAGAPRLLDAWSAEVGLDIGRQIVDGAGRRAGATRH